MEIIRLNLTDYPGPPLPRRTPENLISPTEEVIESHEKESEKELGGGINTTVYIKLKDDGSIVFKPKGGESKRFRKLEQYKRERAAYLVDLFFGFHLVPPTVIREIDGEVGSAQEFIQDAEMGVAYYFEVTENPDLIREALKMDLFDYIINNADRSPDNWLVKDNRIVAIDHGICFYNNINPPRFEIPVEMVENIRGFLTNRESLEVLFELLLELVPQASINAFRERIRLLAEKLNIQHEIR
jgi:hypothetical protein